MQPAPDLDDQGTSHCAHCEQKIPFNQIPVKNNLCRCDTCGRCSDLCPYQYLKEGICWHCQQIATSYESLIKDKQCGCETCGMCSVKCPFLNTETQFCQHCQIRIKKLQESSCGCEICGECNGKCPMQAFARGQYCLRSDIWCVNCKKSEIKIGQRLIRLNCGQGLCLKCQDSENHKCDKCPLLKKQTYENSEVTCKIVQQIEKKITRTLKELSNLSTQNVMNAMNKIMELSSINEENRALIVSQVLGDPPTLQQRKKSEQLEQKFRKQVQQNTKQKNSLQKMLLSLKSQCATVGLEVIFCEKTDIRTQYGMKVCFSEASGDVDKKKKSIPIQKMGSTAQEKLNKLKADINSQNAAQAMSKFNQWCAEHICSRYKIKRTNLTILEVLLQENNERLIVLTDDELSEIKTQQLKVQNFPAYLEYLHLSLEDFQDTYDTCEIKSNKCQAKRNESGFPYYPPYGCTVFPLKFQGITELQKNTWARGYQGIDHPDETSGGMKASIETKNGQKTSKVKCISKSKKVRPGPKQRYRNSANIHYGYSNQQGEQKNKYVKVGKGVYTSPHISECTDFVSRVKGSKFKDNYILVQCLMHPIHLRIPEERHDYWVTSTKYIRPFAIVMLVMEDPTAYPKPIDQFREGYFNYEDNFPQRRRPKTRKISHVKTESYDIKQDDYTNQSDPKLNSSTQGANSMASSHL